MIAYAHTSLRVLGSWFCVVVWRVGVRYSSRRRVVVRVWVVVRVVACVCARVLCACLFVWLRVWVCVGGRACVRGPPLVVCCGGFLLSRTPWGAVPLARPGLASRFGMLLGVSPVL